MARVDGALILFMGSMIGGCGRGNCWEKFEPPAVGSTRPKLSQDSVPTVALAEVVPRRPLDLPNSLSRGALSQEPRRCFVFW
ncbi:hypothetical protein B0H14DRAFT_2734376 [Mycena olivaceomarginata]|nr:hypothetical protein B0H14DRAFT_2734376 [Mycena olivaceomarginata]